MAAGQLEECAFARLHGPVIPRQMRSRCLGAGTKQGHDRGIVATEPVHPAYAGIVDLRNQIAFAHSRLDLVDDALMHRGDDTAGATHVFEFRGALDGTFPVHQLARVDEVRLRQMRHERRMGRSGEPVIVELDADGSAFPPTILDKNRQKVHRMAIDRLHIMIGVADDVVVLQPGRAFRAVRVLGPAIPDRRALGRQQHALMHVE